MHPVRFIGTLSFKHWNSNSLPVSPCLEYILKGVRLQNYKLCIIVPPVYKIR